MSSLLGTCDDKYVLSDEVAASMYEQVLDIYRVKQQWPFPKWVNGRIVKLREVKPPFNIQDCEEALF